MTYQKLVLEKLTKSIANVLVEKESITELILIALLSKGHILLEDVPGTGKTLLAKSIADSIDVKFRRVQFTPDVLPSDVTGIQFFNMKSQSFELKFGPIMTNLLLVDEINRATPRSQSSLLEAMEERQVTIDGETHALPKPFIVIATQNPIESQQGTFSLPEAQMDRFLMQIKTGYPSYEGERQMIEKYKHHNPIGTLKAVVTREEIFHMQEELVDVEINQAVEEYILSIIFATRNNLDIEVGVSPRGTLAFIRSLQARAYLNNRGFVIPDDVKALAPYVLAHRLVLSLHSSMRKTKEDVLKEVISQIKVPVEAGFIE